jgi:hypothetical protein
MNDELAITKTRDIIKALFIAEIECNPNSEDILTEDFIKYNYPPFVDFIKTFNKNKNNMEEIRNISNKCFLFNISINNIVEDFINLVDFGDHYIKIKYSKIPKKKLEEVKKNEKINIINIGMQVDCILSQTNKTREPIHIEMLLYKLLY